MISKNLFPENPNEGSVHALHSYLDFKFVSKKDLQTCFLGQEHLITLYIL